MAGDRVLTMHHAAMLHGQVEALLPMIDVVMREAGVAVPAIDLIAVTTGPGSFTGIRVGLAAARGAALAAGVPVAGVTSFDATAAIALAGAPRCCLLAALETRRADLYVQFFNRDGRPVGAPAALLPEGLPAAAAAAVGARPLAITGDAARRAADALALRSATVVLEGELPPLAVGAAMAALARWRRGESGGQPAPLYLRPPGVTLGQRPPLAGR
jgi:tRNA threonylcarbamoyladenosine biosynthesis protein TsaB